jgi:hypothetical protein
MKTLRAGNRCAEFNRMKALPDFLSDEDKHLLTAMHELREKYRQEGEEILRPCREHRVRLSRVLPPNDPPPAKE